MELFEFLKPQWRRTNPQTRLAGVRDLQDIDVLGGLAQNDPDQTVRSAVIERLCDLLLTSTDPKRRRAIAKILGHCGDSRAIETLFRAVQEPLCLGRSPRMLFAESEDLGDSILEDTTTYIEILRVLCARQIGALLPLLSDYSRTRNLALKLVTMIGDRRAIEPLKNGALTCGQRPQNPYLDALTEMKWVPSTAEEYVLVALAKDDFATAAGHGSSAVESLIVVLHGGNKERTIAAAETLGKIGDHRAIDALTYELSKNLAWMRRWSEEGNSKRFGRKDSTLVVVCANALATIGGDAAKMSLTKAQTEATPLYSEYPEIQQAIEGRSQGANTPGHDSYGA